MLGAWAIALVALGMAVVFSRLVVTVPPAGTEVRPWVGSYLLFDRLLGVNIGGGVVERAVEGLLGGPA